MELERLKLPASKMPTMQKRIYVAFRMWTERKFSLSVGFMEGGLFLMP
jgi:hypothetical protein